MSLIKVFEDLVSSLCISEDTRGSLAVSGEGVAMPEEDKVVYGERGKGKVK